MLILELPSQHVAEQSYVVDWVMRERLGIEHRVVFGPRNHVVRIHDGGERSVVVRADLFAHPDDDWLTHACLPASPPAWWEVPGIGAHLREDQVPVLYGSGDVRREGAAVELGLDVFGGIFFLLSRMEEVLLAERDEHGRFPANASFAHRHGFLQRPVADEYVEILWACLRLAWPDLQRRDEPFRQILTHDVDLLRRYADPARLVIGDLVKRRDPGLAARDLWGWVRGRCGIGKDPYDTFDLIMDLSERAGLRSAFYFITDWSHPVYDRGYRFGRPEVRGLLRRIAERGHEIGLHGSYNSHAQLPQLHREFDILRRVCDQEGIHQDAWGGRQHYLRWSTPGTYQVWSDAGLDYDSSMGFAAATGFRCGTCHEHRVFNVLSGDVLRLRERPLIAMECSAIDARYEGLGAGEAARTRFLDLQETCRHYGGDFVLLWHNNRLACPRERRLYGEIVSYGGDAGRIAAAPVAPVGMMPSLAADGA